MKISGALEDAGVAEVMQLVHFGARSGTLTVTSGPHRGEVEFHRGRVVRAWATNQPRLGDLLVAAGHLTPDRLAPFTAAPQQGPLGPALLRARAVDRRVLQEAVEEQIQRVVFDIVGWTRGRFAFALGDGNGGDVPAPRQGEVLPGLELDTQKLLLEAVRRLDESRHPRARSAFPARDDDLDSLEGTLSGMEPPEETPRPSPRIVQVVSRDPELAGSLRAPLAVHGLDTVPVALRDAGAALPGQAPPAVLVDLRDGREAADLEVLVRLHPAAPLVALVDGLVAATAAFDAGARAVVHPDPAEIVACLRRTVERPPAEPEDDPERDPVVGRLRRVVGDIRSGLFSASLALSLMNLVADAAERAILFLVRRDALQPLGAFGFARKTDRPLIETVRHLALPRSEAGLLEEAIREGRVREIQWNDPGLPEPFRQRVGAPVSGQALLVPVLGHDRAIALIYVDNGPLWAPLRDAALLELATAQVGYAFENELLRNLLSHPERRSQRDAAGQELRP